MAKRTTIADIAEKAGVSVATVDRVLNGRHNVRAVTAQRVCEAANELGYYAANVMRTRVLQNRRQYQLGILLQRPRHAFYQRIAAAFAEQVKQYEQLGIQLHIEYLESQIPAEVAAHLRRLGQRVQALAVTTIDHALLTQAVAELRARHIPVFTLLSDMATEVRAGYIGVDNRKVGRTSAWLLSRLARKPGKVAIFVGSHRFTGHEMREIGFRTYFREHAPDFEVIDTLVNLEVRQITHEATLNLLERHPDLVGLYVAGGGMEGAIAAMQSEQQDPALVAICNELTDESRAGLAEGILSMVITTPVEMLVSETLAQMLRAIDHGGDVQTGMTVLPFGMHTPENI